MLPALPTTLRLPRNRLTFRLAHRFGHPLGESGLDDLWGMDPGAIIGLEFRHGLVRVGQIGFSRTSDRTTALFARYDVARQGCRLPMGIAALGSVEGTDHTVDLTPSDVGQVAGGTRVSKTSSSDAGHVHTVTFN